MANPTLASGHINQPLTDTAVAYMQDPEKFVAHQASPLILTPKMSDSYYVFNKEDWLRDDAEVLAEGAESAGGGYRLSTDTFQCVPYGYHKDISWLSRSNQDAVLDEDNDAAEFVAHKMALKCEVLFKTAAFATSIWGRDITGHATAEADTTTVYWGSAGSTPVDAVLRQCNYVESLTGYRPNIMVMGPDVERALYSSPDVRDRMPNDTNRTPTNEDLARTFKLKRVVTARAVSTTSKEGQASQTTAFLYGKSALLMHVPEKPGKRTPSAMYTFAWKPYSDAKGGALLDKYEIRSRRSDRVDGIVAVQHKIIASSLGVFFSLVVQ